MRVGVGLPATIAGIGGKQMLDWARQADRGPFASLALNDRVVYDSYEALTTLAAAAATTERVRLVTYIAIGPLRNTAFLAKEAATIDVLSGGRLTLGLALGARQDDYDVVGVDMKTRGRRLTDQLGTLRDIWEEGRIGPRPVQPGGPPLLVGGTASDLAFARMARYADGFVHGGGPPKTFARAADNANAAWRDAGRPGRPQLWGQGYFALTDPAAGAAWLQSYYAFLGPGADRIAEGLLTTPQAIVRYLRGYAEAGCDEVVLFPTVADPQELQRLATVVAGL